MTGRSDTTSKLTHECIWNAIALLAKREGVSLSSLARTSGLDPTSFNRSKRFYQNGKPRWPSTLAISKVLNATECDLTEFALLARPHISKNAGQNEIRRLTEKPN